MLRFIIVCVANGLLFGMLDGIINANPLARRFYEVYAPVAKESINVPLGLLIDLIYGIVMGLVFLLLFQALPGDSGLVKGLAFGAIVWFFRVFMSTMTQLMTHKVPFLTLLYTLVTGIIEMLIIGLVYGAFLKPLN
jgi:uncharacterized membrane protein YagU involved in acid resistance